MKTSRIFLALIVLMCTAVVVNALPTGFAWHAGTGFEVSRESVSADHSSSFEVRTPKDDQVAWNFSVPGSWDGGGLAPVQETPPTA